MKRIFVCLAFATFAMASAGDPLPAPVPPPWDWSQFYVPTENYFRSLHALLPGVAVSPNRFVHMDSWRGQCAAHFDSVNNRGQFLHDAVLTYLPREVAGEHAELSLVIKKDLSRERALAQALSGNSHWSAPSQNTSGTTVFGPQDVSSQFAKTVYEISYTVSTLHGREYLLVGQRCTDAKGCGTERGRPDARQGEYLNLCYFPSELPLPFVGDLLQEIADYLYSYKRQVAEAAVKEIGRLRAPTGDPLGNAKRERLVLFSLYALRPLLEADPSEALATDILPRLHAEIERATAIGIDGLRWFFPEPDELRVLALQLLRMETRAAAPFVSEATGAEELRALAFSLGVALASVQGHTGRPFVPPSVLPALQQARKAVEFLERNRKTAPLGRAIASLVDYEEWLAGLD